jgi:hypothetical protein
MDRSSIAWRPMISFLATIGGGAALLQSLLVRTWSLSSAWSYLGTASLVFFVGLVVMNRWLWRIRVGKWRPFNWVTTMPDISGEWNVEMQPAWMKGGPFSSRATIRQTLLSIQIDIERPASYSESRSASVFSTSENRWQFACVYENRAGLDREKYTIDHYGCFLVRIDSTVDPSNNMTGRYWTNKSATVQLPQLAHCSSTMALG